MSAQQGFYAALLAPETARPKGLSDGEHRDAGRRFDIYRNNVTVSLIEALETGFPVLTKLIGADNMRQLARRYLRAHPPESPVLMLYGEHLPAFIAAQDPLAHLPYLTDVARLELAMRHAYHAEDAAAIDPAVLGEMAPEQLLASRINFAPPMRLVRSAYPIHGIWRFNSESGAPKPTTGAEDVLVTRPEFDPIPMLLPDGGADWIAALQSDATIGDALDGLPGFDPGETLTLLIRGGAIKNIRNES